MIKFLFLNKYKFISFYIIKNTFLRWMWWHVPLALVFKRSWNMNIITVLNPAWIITEFEANQGYNVRALDSWEVSLLQASA